MYRVYNLKQINNLCNKYKYKYANKLLDMTVHKYLLYVHAFEDTAR